MIPTLSSTDPRPGAPAAAAGIDAPDLRVFVFGLFFIFGGITSLNDVIIPKLKGLFELSYGEAMLVQSAFFGAYLLVSLPAAALVRRIGYMRAAVAGLVAMMAGCLLFVPASAAASFGLFLVALFVLAAGITAVQVVANPLISLLGPPATAHSRLTFAQGFNSLGTTIFPFVGSILILGSLADTDAARLTGAALDAYRAAETRVVVHAYLALAGALALIALVVWSRRRRLPASAAGEGGGGAFDLLRRPRFALGTAAIFLYVGAEVAIGSLIVSYLMDAGTLGLAEQDAGKHVPFYWGGAMIGRFLGAGILRVAPPGRVLAGVAGGAVALLLVSANGAGAVSAWALLAVGLMNAVMFPTIFGLASEGLGARAADGSGIICMAIVGGAVIPPLTGHLADAVGLKAALALPAACYVLIALYGLYARRPAA